VGKFGRICRVAEVIFRRISRAQIAQAYKFFTCLQIAGSELPLGCHFRAIVWLPEFNYGSIQQVAIGCTGLQLTGKCENFCDHSSCAGGIGTVNCIRLLLLIFE
jgi:hypothetical protein